MWHLCGCFFDKYFLFDPKVENKRRGPALRSTVLRAEIKAGLSLTHNLMTKYWKCLIIRWKFLRWKSDINKWKGARVWSMPVVLITMWNKKNGVSKLWLVPHLFSTVSTSTILNLKYWRIARYGVVYLFFYFFGKSILRCFKMSFDVLNSRLKIFDCYILSNQCTKYNAYTLLLIIFYSDPPFLKYIYWNSNFLYVNRLATIKTWEFSAYPINTQFKDIIQGSNNRPRYIRR